MGAKPQQLVPLADRLQPEVSRGAPVRSGRVSGPKPQRASARSDHKCRVCRVSGIYRSHVYLAGVPAQPTCEADQSSQLPYNQRLKD